MANVIIGIHGLGNKPPREVLENWWKMALQEGLAAKKFNTSLPKFELVYWADILYEKPLSENENEDSHYFLDEIYVQAPKEFQFEDHSTRRKVIDFMGKQIKRLLLNKDYSLNYSGITDAILEKYFKDLDAYYSNDTLNKNCETCKTKELINQRLIQVLEKNRKNNIFLIAHSMGSIIAFEVLKFAKPEIPIHTLATIGSPLGLPPVISKIADEQKQYKTEKINMATPDSIFRNWFNFSDILDKVAFDYKLADDFTENQNGIKPMDFLVINNYEINGKRNSHKSFGYLRTPDFSTVLNNFILSESKSWGEKLLRTLSKILRRMKSNLSTML